MKRFDASAFVLRIAVPALGLCLSLSSYAQQTLGTVNGTVTDPSGALVSGATVHLKGVGNGIQRDTKSSNSGAYQFLNLPDGSYDLTFTRDGFETTRVPAVDVQQSRSSTVNISLKAGSVNTTVDVDMQPVLNQTDATNGYVLESQQIQETPLATGSFTRLATLTPGVSGELQAGIGTNAGLGNQPIFANGQRDTSNGFQVNGVDVTNLFNGKSSSQDQSQRYSFNIGQGSTGAVAGQNGTDISVFGSNGQGLATPPPEFIQEISVNTSQYDASQGNHSGAQIDVSTATGTNKIHGQVYGYRATNFANAAPFFNKQGVLYQDGIDPTTGIKLQNFLPVALLNPELHRYTAGGTLGGPIVKDKLFLFLGFQYTRDTDASQGISTLAVPVGLTNDRSANGILNAIASYNAVSVANKDASITAPTTVDPVALSLLQATLPNGQYLIPSSQASTLPVTSGAATANDTSASGLSISNTYQAEANLDYNVTHNDHLSLKYYYQHAPVLAPFANANTAGFPSNEDSGAQVGAITNAITIGSRINWQQTMGFSRQKVYSTFDPLFPGNFNIQFPGGTQFPAVTISRSEYNSTAHSITLGPNNSSADAGYFQNRWAPNSTVTVTLGKHNLSAGGNFDYTQLNIRNRRNNLGSVTAANFVAFVQGQVSSSSEITGNTNRYYRANDGGAFLQDQWKVLPNLSITAGVRYDYNGGFTEKYGNIFNFNPSTFSVTPNAVNNDGFVVAGNNAFDPTAGTSNSTLTGRQWGIGPRIGFAYTPKQNGGRVVFHGGFGIFYDRGEYFSYLSQPAGSSIGGPFGATQAPPLVNYVTGTGTLTLENPLGTAVIPPSSANPATFASKLPTAQQIETACAGVTVETSNANGNCAEQPLNFGAYAQNNKLPYTISYSFNTQVQLNKDTSFTIGYLGNVSRHLVIPVPFNEPGVATASNPINGQNSSYGYEVLNENSPTGTNKFNPITTEPYDTYDGGNVDLRVPYVGYSPNAALFEASGISAYNALIGQVNKRMSHYLAAQASYTFSHALDEQSDIGLFFTGDNPDHLRDSYASADFDRTQIFTLGLEAQIPNLTRGSHLLQKFTNGWQITSLTTLQSGQPYSLYEYDGAVGSLYFGNFPTLANPVLGIKDGSHPRSALTGASGAYLNVTSPGTYTYLPAINQSQLAINYISPGNKGVPTCNSSEPCDVFETDFTPGQRNIFRQAPQREADVAFEKLTHFTDRYVLRYSFDVFNISNTTNLDVPSNHATVSGSKLSSSINKSNSVAYGQVASSVSTQSADLNSLYVFPTNTNSFGSVRNTIGLPRTIEMSLHLLF